MIHKIVKLPSIENLLKNKEVQLKAVYFVNTTKFSRFIKGKLTHAIIFNKEPSVDGYFLISCESLNGTVRDCYASTSEYLDILTRFELKSEESI